MRELWQRLSKRERGLVALTLVILFLVLVRYGVVAPFLERREWVKSQLELQPQLLERNLRYVGQKEKVTAALEKARGELKMVEALLFSGDTPSVSASDLQQAVQGLAAKEGTQVISTRVLNPETTGSFIKIPIQIEVSGQIEQVANLIKGIESADKLLLVSELNIRSLFTPAMVRPQQPAAPQAPQQNLRASLTVAGFARAQTAGSSKSEPAPSKTEISPAKSKSEVGKSAEKNTPRR